MSNPAIDWAIGCDLKGSVKSVLLILANRANKEGECFPALSTIAREAGVARSTVQEAIKELERLGLIKKIRRKSTNHPGWTSNLYRLSVDPLPVVGTGCAGDKPSPIPPTGNKPKLGTQTEPKSNQDDRVRQIGGRKGLSKKL